MSTITYRPKINSGYGVKPVVEARETWQDLLLPTYNVAIDLMKSFRTVVAWGWFIYNAFYWYMFWCFFWGLTWAPWMWIPFGTYGWITYFLINSLFALLFFIPVAFEMVVSYIIGKYRKYENNIP